MYCNKLCLAAIFFALLYKEAAEAKIYTRCQLAKALDTNGFPRSFLVHCKLFQISFRFPSTESSHRKVPVETFLPLSGQIQNITSLILTSLLY